MRLERPDYFDDVYCIKKSACHIIITRGKNQSKTECPGGILRDYRSHVQMEQSVTNTGAKVFDVEYCSVASKWLAPGHCPNR